MNHFQLDYPSRLRLWADLREQIREESLYEQCRMVDKWWQQAPLVNHYLHPQDQQNWPNPWELLANNTYCTLARGLGMCYTLYLCKATELELAIATDDQGFEQLLVIVDRAKYILNTWPDGIVNNKLPDFRITQKLDIQNTLRKIR